MIQWHHYQLFNHLQELHLDFMDKLDSVEDVEYRSHKAWKLLNDLSEYQDLSGTTRFTFSGHWFDSYISKFGEDPLFADYKCIKKMKVIVAESHRMQTEITDELESYHFSSCYCEFEEVMFYIFT